MYSGEGSALQCIHACSRHVLTPLSFALWFKHPPLAYNSNKPLKAIVIICDSLSA